MDDRSLIRHINWISHAWFREFWNRGEPAILRDYRASGAVTRGLTFGALDTRWEVALFARTLRSAFSDFRIDLVEMIIDLPMVAYMYVMRGRHVTAILGVPPTGNQVVIRGGIIGEMPCGKMVQTWNAFDLYGLYRQIGANVAPVPDDLFAIPGLVRAWPRRPHVSGVMQSPQLIPVTRQELRNWAVGVWSGEEKDVRELARLIEEDDLGKGTPFDGHPGLIRLVGMVTLLRSAFPDLSVSVAAVLVDKSRAVIRTVCRGTHTGPGLGSLPTGRKAAFETTHWIVHRHGQVLRSWNFIDLHALYSQLDILISLAPRNLHDRPVFSLK